MKISHAQAKTLSKGGSIRVAHKHLASGNDLVYLTQSQMKKLAKHYTMGKGAELKFSQAQLKHHWKKGGSVLSQVWDTAKKIYAHPTTQQFVKTVTQAGKKVVGKLLREGAEHLGNKLAPKFGTSTVRPLAHKALKHFGLGVKKKAAPVKQGKGFFDDVGNFFTHSVPDTFTHTIPNYLSTPSNALGAASTVSSFIPVAGEIISPALGAASLAAKIAGHGLKRRKKSTRGGSFLL